MSGAGGDEEARLQELLDGVWQRRRREMLERFTDLGGDLALLVRTGGTHLQAASGARAEAHRLAGALGSLGFDALAADAAALERMLSRTDPPGLLRGDLVEAATTAARLGRALLDARGRPR